MPRFLITEVHTKFVYRLVEAETQEAAECGNGTEIEQNGLEDEPEYDYSEVHVVEDDTPSVSAALDQVKDQ